jgi:putative FmdB family regulatory protein
MPTYEYKCTNDGSVFELWQEVGAEAPTCPTCGSPTKKVFHPTRTIFKGSGFYITDTRAETGKGASATTEPAPAATETKSEPAPATPAPATPAPTPAATNANTSGPTKAP